MTTPAGWFDDPEDPSQHRYWDGTAWTEHRAPKVATPSSAPPTVASAANSPAPATQDPGSATPYAPTEQNWIRRNPVLAAVIGGAAAIAVIGIIGSALGSVSGNDGPAASNSGNQVKPSDSPTDKQTSSSPSPPPTKDEQEEETEPVAFGGNGTLLVPQEVKPGTYTAPEAAGCYWATLKNLSGGFNAIIANGNASGPIVVTVPSNAKGIELNGCGDWLKGTPTITDDPTKIPDGIWSVPNNLKPGTYRVQTKDCYWARLRNFSGGFNAIIANNNVKGQGIVKIAASDAGFESSNCGTWERVG